MIISDERKFLFIHIQKTAGSSVAKFLRTAAHDSRTVGGKHGSALEARNILGIDAYSEYYSFAFVRNPWDRMVSWYNMIAAHRPKAKLGVLRGGMARLRRRTLRLWDYVYRNSHDFESFLTHCTDVIDDHDGRKCFAFNQVDYLFDEKDDCIVDYVGRFETLAEDFRHLVGRLGLATEEASLPRLNVRPHGHYSRYYTSRTAEIVRRRFRRDIEFFGYEFQDVN